MKNNNVKTLDAEKISLIYEFKNETAGSADGTIKIDFGSKNCEASGTVTLFWATGNCTDGFIALDGYTPIYSSDFAFFADGYTINKELLIPYGVTALLAEINDGENTVKVVCELPKSKLAPERDKPLYTAAFGSDYHFGGWGSEKEAKPGLKNACKEMNEFADFLVASGDLVQWHASYSHTEFMKYNFDGKTYADNGERSTEYLRTGINQWQVLEDYFKGFKIPVYILPGGHDICDTDRWSKVNVTNKYYDDFLKNWIEYSENTSGGGKYPEKITRDESVFYYDTELFGHHYIFLSIPNCEKPYLSFGKKQLDWLDKKLFEKEASGKPIFLFGHTPVYCEPGSIFHHYIRKGNFSAEDAEAFEAVLAKHPTAVYVTGHLHNTLDTDEISSVDGAQITPSHVHDGGMTSVVAPPNMAQIEGTHSVIAEVYKDCVLLRSRDHLYGKWISRGLTKLTFKAPCPIGEISAVKQTGIDGKTTLFAESKNIGIKYVWYLDGKEQTSETVTVDSSYQGYIALRAADNNGNYRSELYESLNEIAEK